MVSIMVNKQEYKPSLHDIMEKYYEMFRSKNQGGKKRILQHSRQSRSLGPELGRRWMK